jgi:hypothetical protein
MIGSQLNPRCTGALRQRRSSVLAPAALARDKLSSALTRRRGRKNHPTRPLGARDFGKPRVPDISNDFQQLLDASASDWRHDPELGKERPDDRIGKHRQGFGISALPKVTGPEED